MRRLLLFLLLSGWLLTGCATTGREVPARESSNFLGLVKIEEASYVPPEETTLALSGNELGANEERTGRKVSLFWGLITYTDY